MARFPGWPLAGAARSGALCLGALALAALLLAPLLAGCGSADEAVDCDQALNDQKYDTVLRHCDNPYQIASAYLGKAGFDTFELVNSTAPAGKVAGLLGLTAGNVNQKRLYINLAIDAVKEPQGGNQAFALLIASFLGLAVTSEQFLDNGIIDTAGTVDPAKVLDDILEPSETEGAMGFVTSTPSMTVWPSSSPAYDAVVYGGVPYVIDCSGNASCGTNPGNHVYDDSLGNGIPDSGSTSSNEPTVLADVGSVTSAGFSVQIADLAIGVGLSAATQEPVTSFLGTVNGDSATFNVGVAGYLNYLRVADAELAAAAGSTGGTDVTAQIDALTNQLDNGAPCATSSASIGVVATLLNEFYAIYAAAPGTVANPVTGTPAAGAFAANNLVKLSDLPNIFLLGALPAIPGGSTFTLDTYKFLYPTVASLGGFTPLSATARLDQAYATFQTEFENIPFFAPAASVAGDGNVTLMEVVCSSD